MMRTLLLKTLYDKRWFIAGWSLIIVVTIVLTIAFYPALSRGHALEQLANTTPGQLKGLVGNQESFRSIQGYVGEQLYNLRIPLMLMIMALTLAQSLTVGDEERGTLRTLSAVPLGRSRILWEKWLAGVIILGIVALLGIIAGYIASIGINEALSFDFSWRLGLLSLLFGVTAFTLIYAVGAATGSRALTMIVGLTIIIGSFILTTFGMAVDWLKNWDILSLMHYANTDSILKGNLDRLNLWILTLLTTLSLLVAIILFRRRDIA